MAGTPAQAHAKTYHTVTPYLVVHDVPRLIDFLVNAFGATERMRLPRADGSIMHAEVALGDSIIMMGQPTPGQPPFPASIFLRVADADAAYQAALGAGAKSLAPVSDKPHARERYGGVIDPTGNQWWPAAEF